MKKVPFKTGIHPDDGKKFAKDKPITKIQRNAPLMVFPLSQHIGAPAEPVVSVGDRVLQGQMIAKASSFVSSPVFSSVSGTVKAIEDRVLFNGNMAKSIVV